MFYRSSPKRDIGPPSAKWVLCSAVGPGKIDALLGEGSTEELDSIPGCLKPVRFQLLPSPGFLPAALSLQGIITAREIIGEKKTRPL